MKISKSIILPEFESIESLEQAGNILHKITEAMEDHQIQNYEDAVASFRRVTTGRIQSQDGKTYFDLDSGTIRGEIVFRKGSSGLDNVEEASPNDWDNAFRLANAVKGDDDFTLISGGKILTGSVAVGAFNSDVVARMFASDENKTNIEAWMKSGAITYIDGAKIYTGSITAGKITVDDLAAIQATLGTVHSGTIYGTRFRVGGGTDEDIYFEDSGIRMYDIGNRAIRIHKDATTYLTIDLNTSGLTTLIVNGSLKIAAGSNNFAFKNTGKLLLPPLDDAPTANANGDIAMASLGLAADMFKFYASGGWRNVDGQNGW